MSTATIYVKGVCKWAKVKKAQMDTRYVDKSDPDNGKFSITLYPDAEGLVTLKTAGARNKRYDDEDGTSFKFSRDNVKEFKGERVILGPPAVLDKDGKRFEDAIGNGSTVTCKLDIYDSKFGKGTRLEAIRVEELVPYEGKLSEGDYPF